MATEPRDENFGRQRRALSIGLSMALLVTGWGELYFNRSAYIVEGTIRAVVNRTYPWNAGGRFDLVMQIGNGGWLRFPSLHGACADASSLGGACDKPEFPIDGAIRLEVYSFADPNACPDLGRFLADYGCFSRFWRRHAYISAIQVGGQPVLAGWSSNLSVLALYGVIAAISSLLAWHNWQFSAIRVRTLIVFFVMVWGCILWPISRYF
jgi:hypothetical protein